jgi:hypothetical protein
VTHHNRFRVWLAIGLVTIALRSNAGEWFPRVFAKLRDAQTACSDMLSDSCRPYLIVAETVTTVLLSQASPRTPQGDVTLVFRKGEAQHCSVQWLLSLNGGNLLQTALGLVRDEGAEHVFWTVALMRSAQTLCQNSRSDTPP